MLNLLWELFWMLFKNHIKPSGESVVHIVIDTGALRGADTFAVSLW